MTTERSQPGRPDRARNSRARGEGGPGGAGAADGLVDRLTRALKLANDDRNALAEAVERLTAQNEMLAAQRDASERRAQSAEEELRGVDLWLRQLESSRSWRLTQPARAIAGALRRDNPKPRPKRSGTDDE